MHTSSLKTKLDEVVVIPSSAGETEHWFEEAIRDDETVLFWDTETNSKRVWVDNFVITVLSFWTDYAKKPLVIVTPEYYATPELLGDRYPWDPIFAVTRDVLASGIRKVGHNIKYDEQAVKRKYGFSVKGYFGDTMINEYCIDPNTLGQRGLDNLIIKYLPHVPTYWEGLVDGGADDDTGSAGIDYSKIVPEKLLPYAGFDSQHTGGVFAKQMAILEAAPPNKFVRVGEDGKMELAPTYSIGEYAMFGRRCHHVICSHMEKVGAKIDMDVVGSIQSHYEAVADECWKGLCSDPQVIAFQEDAENGLAAKMSKSAWKKHVKTVWEKHGGKPRTPFAKQMKALVEKNQTESPRINWGSVIEVRAFFVDYLGMPAIKNSETTGDASTDEQSLTEWFTSGTGDKDAEGRTVGCPVAGKLLEWRGATKFLTSYIKPLVTEDVKKRHLYQGFIHPNFKVASVITGRLSACVDADTLITTRRGLVPIRSLAIGDEVLTHKSRYKRCLNVFIKSYDEQFLVTASNGSQIVCTAAHKFLTPDGRWVELRELSVGDQVSAVRGDIVAIKKAGETRQADGSVVPRLRPVVLKRCDGGGGVEEARSAALCGSEFGGILQDGSGDAASEAQRGESTDGQNCERRREFETGEAEGTEGERAATCDAGRNTAERGASAAHASSSAGRQVSGTAQGGLSEVLSRPVPVNNLIEALGDRSASDHELCEVLRVDQGAEGGAIARGDVEGDAGKQSGAAAETANLIAEGGARESVGGRQNDVADREGITNESVAGEAESDALRNRGYRRISKERGAACGGGVGAVQPRHHEGISGVSEASGRLRGTALHSASANGGASVFDERGEEVRETPVGARVVQSQRGGGSPCIGDAKVQRAPQQTAQDNNREPLADCGLLPQAECGAGTRRVCSSGREQPGGGCCHDRADGKHRVQSYPNEVENGGEEPCERVAVSIVGVEPVGVRETWDCTIEDDESYVGNTCFFAHNSMPNVQALPRTGLVKRLYNSRFDNGWILQRDYSGLEVRILAAMSQDPILVHIFNTGGDAHFRTQEHFFKEAASKADKDQRSVCKQSLFGRLYGQGDKGLFDLLRKNRVKSPTTGLPIEMDECAKFNKMIDELYEFVCTWVEFAHDQAVHSLKITSAFGYTVPVPILALFRQWRRNRRIPEGKEIAARLRHSQNYPIQSCASDYTIYSAYRIRQRMIQAKLASQLFLIVHDAIYVDCVPEEVIEVGRIMEEVMDHVPEWIDEVLPGINTDWMRVVPIIGEQEVGVNALDALKVKREPSKDFADMIFEAPSIKEGDGRMSLHNDCFKGIEKLTWSEHRESIRRWLDGQRMIF